MTFPFRIPFPLRLVLLGLLLAAGSTAQGGIARYSDRGHIDFDTALDLLKPYGTWAKVDGLWAYTPADHQAPYTHGRWLYTEYGWYWKGDLPHSWATEHYGYWKRGANKVWAWYPGPYWLPEIVELRATTGAVGWRSAAVDDDGNFVEAPDERYAHTDEWTFVSKPQFAAPITPAVIATPAQAASLLDDSTDCTHTYVTYRPIDRPGPHPADFLALSRDDGMFAPEVYRQRGPKVTLQSVTTQVSTAAAPVAPATAAKTAPAPAANIPDLGDDSAQPADARQVPYWVTMCLPTYATPRPADAEPNEIYVYRPEFYQDQDGIERRISLWLDPSARTSVGARLRDLLAARPTAAVTTPLPPGSPAVPVAPASSEGGAFRSPFDDSFHGGTAAPAKTPSASSKAAPAGLAGTAPSGIAAP
jgi:hypothetical protein